MARTPESILVIAAHPDDEVIGCGGTLLKWKDAGHQIFIAFAGRGRPDGAQAEDAEKVAKAAGWAIQAMGDFPDQEFDRIGVKAIADWIGHLPLQPHILTHHANDQNQDHRMVYRAACIALRRWKPTVGHQRTWWTFDVPQVGPSDFHPQIFAEVSAHWNRKIELLRTYRQALSNPPAGRTIDALYHGAKSYGKSVGLDMAEGFCLERQIIGQTSGTAS